MTFGSDVNNLVKVSLTMLKKQQEMLKFHKKNRFSKFRTLLIKQGAQIGRNNKFLFSLLANYSDFRFIFGYSTQPPFSYILPTYQVSLFCLRC